MNGPSSQVSQLSQKARLIEPMSTGRLEAFSDAVAVPLYLASLCWALFWWHARRAGLVREEIVASQRNRLSRIFNGSFALHCAWVILSLRWPWAALALGTAQTLLYLLPQRQFNAGGGSEVSHSMHASH